MWMSASRWARVDVVEPVVGDHLARDVEDQPAQAPALVGVGVDAPVALLQVLLHRRLDVDQRTARVAQLAVLVAVDGVGAQRAPVAGVEQRRLDLVLDLLDVRRHRAERGQPRQHPLPRQALGLGAVELAAGDAGARDRAGDLGAVERLDAAVALDDVAGQGGGSGHADSVQYARCSVRTRG
jgi:hypothetical protein